MQSIPHHFGGFLSPPCPPPPPPNFDERYAQNTLHQRLRKGIFWKNRPKSKLACISCTHRCSIRAKSCSISSDGVKQRNTLCGWIPVKGIAEDDGGSNRTDDQRRKATEKQKKGRKTMPVPLEHSPFLPPFLRSETAIRGQRLVFLPVLSRSMQHSAALLQNQCVKSHSINHQDRV